VRVYGYGIRRISKTVSGNDFEHAHHINQIRPRNQNPIRPEIRKKNNIGESSAAQQGQLISA
jgi:hypothetical protein